LLADFAETGGSGARWPYLQGLYSLYQLANSLPARAREGLAHIISGIIDELDDLSDREHEAVAVLDSLIHPK
jgi:hypothetical protein